MNELYKHLPDSCRANVAWPKDETIILREELDYVFIFRKDLVFATKPVAEAFTFSEGGSASHVQRVLIEEYDTFFAKLMDLMQWGHRHRGNVEIHLFDPDKLEVEARKKAADSTILCLDPLVTNEVHELAVSREYVYGGKHLLQRIARPGSAPFEQQIEAALQGHPDKPITLLDDDLFRGGTLLDTIELLGSKNVRVDKIIPEIKIGDFPESLPEHIVLDPVVEYRDKDGFDVLNKANLADARDYLVGFSGLVVKLPSGRHGRAPYVLPFLPTSEKTGILPKDNASFSQAVLKANLDFYSHVEEKLGQPIQLRHMHPDFVRLMREVYGFDTTFSMKEMVRWVLENTDEILEQTEQLEILGLLKELEMPDRLVFIDVNGTILPEGETDGQFDDEQLHQLSETILIAQRLGYGVGLCSDSSLEKLMNLSDALGLEGPLLAENGNIVKYGDKVTIVRSLKEQDGIVGEVRQALSESGFIETIDSSPLVFGGKHAEHGDNKWAFGYGRTTSISIYAPAEAVEILSDKLVPSIGFSIDASVEHNYLGIHPGDYTKNKSLTLQLISQISKDVLMIGNSNSDWIEPKTGVQVGFVSNASADHEYYQHAKYRSTKPLSLGVSEILRMHIGNIPENLRLHEVLTGGEINSTCSVFFDDKPAILQSINGIGNPDLAHLSEYFNGDKLGKINALQPVLSKYGIPSPNTILAASGDATPWILFDRAEGVNLASVFPHLSEEQRDLAVYNMAECLSLIHSIPIDQLPKHITFQMPNPQRFELLVDSLVNLSILTEQQGYQAREYFLENTYKARPVKLALVHRDYFQRNLFVDQNNMEITSVIDWGDTSCVGDIFEDILLSAEWISDGDNSIFWDFIRYYNHHSKHKVDSSETIQLLSGYRLQWFCEIALLNYFRGNELQLNKQISRIKDVLAANISN